MDHQAKWIYPSNSQRQFAPNCDQQQRGVARNNFKNNRASRSIQPNFVNNDGTYDVEKIPMTPSLAAMTPRSRSVTIGQILLARALVSDVIGDRRNCAPLSHSEVEAAPTPRAPAREVPSMDTGFVSSPNTVSKLPRTPPIVPVAASPTFVSSPRAPAPSPNSAKKLSKEDFQALVNARVNKSISQRNAQVKYEKVPEPKKVNNRFNTVYMTPGGQTIAFKNTGKNTPPTPKFGSSAKKPVDVEWSAYEAVHESVSPEMRPQSWRVTPAHSESTVIWSQSIPPPINSSMSSLSLGQRQGAYPDRYELQFGTGL